MHKLAPGTRLDFLYDNTTIDEKFTVDEDVAILLAGMRQYGSGEPVSSAMLFRSVERTHTTP